MTLYRILPECDGCRYTEGQCIAAIRNGAIKCCPDCKHRQAVAVDWEAAAVEFEQLSALDFDPERAVRAILVSALGEMP